MAKDEPKFRDLAESLPHMVWTCEPEGPCDYLSPQWVRYTGIPEDEQLGFGWLEQLHPDDVALTKARWAAATQTGASFDTEFRIRRHDGEYRWFKTRAVPCRDARGAIAKWYGTNTDIQDLRDAQEATARLNRELEQRVASRTDELRAANERLERLAAQLHTALQEVHHRVKNNLQVIASLLNMQARQARDVATRDALGECRSRIIAIALIHEQLYGWEDYSRIPFSEYAQHLAHNVFAASGADPERVRLVLEVEPIALPVEQAIPCGLILNELVTNALKHAFPGGRRGTVTISVRASGPELTLAVFDDGVGLADDVVLHRRGSLGMQLVSVLCKQLGARLEIATDGGARFAIAMRTPEQAALPVAGPAS